MKESTTVTAENAYDFVPFIGPAFKDAWDFVAKDLDADIRQAFEKLYRERVGDTPQPAWYYISSSHLTALTLQLVRELKKQNENNKTDNADNG